MINYDSNTTAAKLQDTTATLLTTKEAAELLGVSVSTMKNLRTRKLFGCPFFTADVSYGNTWYYNRERVEQLKSVYRKGVLDNMYKLAFLNAEAEEDHSEFFQKRDSNAELPAVTRHRGLLTAEYVAAKFNVTVKAVEKWVKSGELHWTEFDHKHRLLFSDDDLEAFERRRTKNGGKTMANSSTNEKNISVDNRIAEAKSFFDKLYGKIAEQHFSYLITFKDPETFDFVIADETQRAAMARKAIELADRGKQVWHAVNPVSVKPHYEFDESRGKEIFKRGEQGVVSYQTAIVVDIDIQSDAHKKDNLVTDFDEAKSFLPFTPSLILNSGYGLHAYYIFDEPIKITDDNREEIKRRNKLLLDVIRKKAGGKEIDGVGDLPRVLRTPGTFNYKTGRENAPMCHVVDDNDISFTPAEIDEKLAAFKPADENLFDAKKNLRSDTGAKKSERQADDLFGNDDFGSNRDYDEYRAAIMLECINPADLADTDWLCVISSCKNLGISNSVVDAWNSRDPARYNEAENQKRWDSLKDPSYDIETLHGIAKRFGYDEKSTRREWYQLHPELKTVTHDLQALRADAKRRQFALHPALRGRKDLTFTDEQREFLFAGDLSDLDFARRIEYKFGKAIRWLTDRNRWATYNKKGVWTISNEGNAAISPAATMLADMLRFNVRPAKLPADGKLTDDDIREQRRAAWELAVAEQLKRANKTAGAITKLCSLSSIRITADDLDNHPELLNCTNGVVDLQTGKFFSAAPELLLSQQVAADYQPNYRNEVVDNFFETILPDDDTRAALIRWLGYAITGDVNEEKALFTIGSGGNGKGTLTRFLITLLNSYAASIPVTAVCEAGRFKDAGAATPELNALEKCRLAIVEELPQGVRLDVAKFKLLTGGDKIPVRRLHEEFRNILPTHKLWLSGNHLPTLNDTRDPGLLRRLMNMQFLADFTKNPDRKLKQKLSTPEALRALLSLVVAAAQDWYRDGLLESSAMKQARTDYLDANDFIKEFISEHCFRAPNASIPRKAFLNRLRSEYSSECSQMTDRMLTEAVAKISGISYRRGGKNKTFNFYGVDFNKTDDDDNWSVDSAPTGDPREQTDSYEEIIDETYFSETD